MSSAVAGEIEREVEQLRRDGRVPEGLEAELGATFAAVADACLADGDPPEAPAPAAGAAASRLPARLVRAARRRVGPTARGVERHGVLAAGRAAERGSTQAHVTADHLERLALGSSLGRRALGVVHGGSSGEVAPATPTSPLLAGALAEFVLDRVLEGAPSAPVLHAECGDGAFVEALHARGADGRGADPRLPGRRRGATSRLVAAGAFEYLGACPRDFLGGLVLSGVVDHLRPGRPRALAHLVSSRLSPGATVVLVGTRPEAYVAADPVTADLEGARPVHAVTWCHLFARYGLAELAVDAPEGEGGEVVVVSATKPLP